VVRRWVGLVDAGVVHVHNHQLGHTCSRTAVKASPSVRRDHGPKQDANLMYGGGEGLAGFRRGDAQGGSPSTLSAAVSEITESQARPHKTPRIHGAHS
jgi:hypothetical protein